MAREALDFTHEREQAMQHATARIEAVFAQPVAE